MKRIRLDEKFALFEERWTPKIVGQINDMHVKVAKLEGTFPWHSHATEDELFLVVRGVLRIEFREGDVTLSAGDMVIVPRGVEHRPVADEEVHVLLVEPASTVNTGNVRSDQTIERPDWI